MDKRDGMLWAKAFSVSFAFGMLLCCLAEKF